MLLVLYSYDEPGRVVVKSVPLVGASVYQYDLTAGLPAGHVKETTWDVKGNIAEREYDKLGRMIRVTSDGETVEYQYYQDGNRKSVVYPSASETYTCDAAGQLLTLENRKTDGTLIDDYSYTYDAAGNQLGKTDAKGVTSYTYDSLNRLIKVVEPGGKVTEYTYDKAGNRKTEKVTDGTNITYEYNAQNRLLAKTQANSDGSKDTTRYNYDNNGNLIYQAVETLKPITPEDKPHFSVFVIGQTESEMSRRVVIYAYDNFNQLTSARTGGTTAEYAYNGEGLRVKKTVNGEITIYLYEYDRVVLELDQYGRQKARNVYGINLLTRAVDGEKYYYLYNGHADVTVLIDASTGLIAASYYYDAFGNILEETGAVNSPILYAGYQYDEETGLYYLNARMYDPKIARFLQEDAYRGDRNDPLSLHLYAYCFNNPLRYFDPTGHMGVAVRTAEEAKGNTVVWKAGTKPGLSTIIVTRSDGSTETLHEGVDYETGKDGRAYYVVRGEPSTGGSAGYVGQRKDTGAIAGALDGDIAPDYLSEVVLDDGADPSKQLLGAGVQAELTVGQMPIGVEVIWYLENTFVDDPRYEYGLNNAYVYVYSGVGLPTTGDEELLNSLEARLLGGDIKALLEVSGAVVLVFGDDRFRSPEDYEGRFTTVSVIVGYGKFGTSNDPEYKARTVTVGGTYPPRPLQYSGAYTNYTLVKDRTVSQVLYEQLERHRENLGDMLGLKWLSPSAEAAPQYASEVNLP